MSGKEVCAILERHGFAEVRRRGSHIVVQRVSDDGSTTAVPVPDHKQVKKGTLRSIIANQACRAASFKLSARSKLNVDTASGGTIEKRRRSGGCQASG
jgi:predicted RNA binding protein YcfA (HicA-like mRNA interferase family)